MIGPFCPRPWCFVFPDAEELFQDRAKFGVTSALEAFFSYRIQLAKTAKCGRARTIPFANSELPLRVDLAGFAEPSANGRCLRVAAVHCLGIGRQETAKAVDPIEAIEF
jgi:hypothetical protein